MKLLLKKAILVVLAIIPVVILVILGIAATKPDRIKVERSIVIEAPPEKIFPHINNFRKWNAWSPWAEKDPNMKKTYSGPETGVGAKYAWSGNDEVGTGTIEIVKIAEPTQVNLKLIFEGPFGASDVAFDLKPVDPVTNVTWSMDGDSPFICKVMQIFFNMEEMIGADYERGLSKLKSIVEAEPKAETDAEPKSEADSKKDVQTETKTESQSE